MNRLKGFMKSIFTPMNDIPEHKVSQWFKQLSFVAVPTGVIGLIATLLGLDTINSSAISLSMICLIYLFIYRSSVGKIIPSYLLICICILLMTIFFVKREYIKTRLSEKVLISTPTGIIKYHKRANEFLTQMPQFIQKSKTEIWIVGVSFYVTVPEHKELFKKRLSEGINIKFLIFDHYSPLLHEVAEGFSQNSEQLRAECITTIESLKEIQNAYDSNNYRGNFEVRLFSSEPRSRFYFFDHQSNEGFTYFVPHVDHQNSPNLPGFLFSNKYMVILPTYLDGVKQLWRKSIRFKDWLEKHGDN